MLSDAFPLPPVSPTRRTEVRAKRMPGDQHDVELVFITDESEDGRRRNANIEKLTKSQLLDLYYQIEDHLRVH